jgi:hypothetical protein
MQCSRLRPAINYADLDQEVLRRLLGNLQEDIKVAISVEDTRVQQFVFHVATIAPFVRLDRVAVGKCGIRILVTKSLALGVHFDTALPRRAR